MILVMLIAGKPFAPGAASAVVDALLVAEDPARGDPLDEKPSGRMASLPPAAPVSCLSSQGAGTLMK